MPDTVTPRLFAAALAGALASAPLLAAPAPPPPPADAPGGTGARQALDRPVTARIDGRPLSEALAELSAQARVRVVLDAAGLPEEPSLTAGVALAREPAVSAEFSGVPFRAALKGVLDPLGLDYAAVGDTVVVSTPGRAAACRLRQRVSVDLDDVGLAEALKRLGRQTGTDLVLDPRAREGAGARVRVQLEDVPLETAVRLLSATAGLKPVRVGPVLFVTTKEAADELRDDTALAPPVPPGGGLRVRRFRW